MRTPIILGNISTRQYPANGMARPWLPLSSPTLRSLSLCQCSSLLLQSRLPIRPTRLEYTGTMPLVGHLFRVQRTLPSQEITWYRLKIWGHSQFRDILAAGYVMAVECTTTDLQSRTSPFQNAGQARTGPNVTNTCSGGYLLRHRPPPERLH